MKKTVYIIRGPSGCGKSTYIRNTLPPAEVVSADNFFLHPLPHQSADVMPESLYPLTFKEGYWFEYRFNPAKLGEAHAWCFTEYLKALAEKNGYNDNANPNIVVDNTNTHLWEFEHYVVAAEAMGYEVKVVAFRAETVEAINLCAQRNKHRVPIEVVAKMAYEYEPYPGEEYVPIYGTREDAAMFLLKQLLNDLPSNRDWLDPNLEKAVQEFLKGERNELP
jgi:predicted kinase